MKSIAILSLFLIWGIGSIAQDSTASKDSMIVCPMDSVDIKPEPVCGVAEFISRLITNIHMSPIRPDEEGQFEGTFYFQIVVNTDSSSSKIGFIQGTETLNPNRLNDEVLNGVILTLNSSKWKPAMKDGKLVSSLFIMPVHIYPARE